MQYIWYIVVGVAALALGILFGVILRKGIAESKIKSAEAEAKRIVDDAVKTAEARKKAEEAIHGEVIRFYEKWSEKAAADPVWAKDHPIKIRVSRNADADLSVQLQPDL